MYKHPEQQRFTENPFPGGHHTGENVSAPASVLRHIDSVRSTRDLKLAEEAMENIEVREHRDRFGEESRQMLQDPVADYTRHVHCHDSKEELDHHAQHVAEYKRLPWYKKMLVKNPEVKIPPPGYEIARLIQLYIEAVEK